MHEEFVFHIKSTRFDENYQPSHSTRLTTNFANLARGASRKQNLRNALRMIDNRCNALAHWDNPTGDRYTVELDIISVEMLLDGQGSDAAFPLIEVLKTCVFDKHKNQRIDGIVGNSFSSYVRDYDFSVLLPGYNADRSEFGLPANFGDLHGKLFKQFANSSTYKARFGKPPVICISVSTSKTYRRTDNLHPVLGVEYQQSELSSTDHYFAKMAETNDRPVVHSDRGGHYRWPGWLSRMSEANLTRSMSRKACSPDNAACEGFFGTGLAKRFLRRRLVALAVLIHVGHRVLPCQRVHRRTGFLGDDQCLGSGDHHGDIAAM